MLKRILGSCLILLMIFTLTGCQFFHKDDKAKGDAAVDDAGSSDVPSEEQALFGGGPKPSTSNYRPISVVMHDGLKIVGTLYVPGLSPYKPDPNGADDSGDSGDDGSSDAPAVKPAKVQYPLIVLLHMLSGDRWDWKDMPRHLSNAGYSVLAIDLRGHGESVYQGKTLRVWRQFDTTDWQKMSQDLGPVLDYIAKQQGFNMVNTHKVGIIGASIGANVAVNYAGAHPKQVQALVLLSPGLEYHGVQTFTPLTHYENAIFFLSSQEDAYASDSSQRLYKFALGKKKIQIFSDLGHGTDMLTSSPALGKDILDWLKSVLPPTAVVSAPSEETPLASTVKEKATEKEKPAASKDKKPNEKKPADKKAEKAKNPKNKKPAKPVTQKTTAKDQKATDASKTAPQPSSTPSKDAVTSPASAPAIQPQTDNAPKTDANPQTPGTTAPAKIEDKGPAGTAAPVSPVPVAAPVEKTVHPKASKAHKKSLISKKNNKPAKSQTVEAKATPPEAAPPSIPAGGQ